MTVQTPTQTARRLFIVSDDLPAFLPEFFRRVLEHRPDDVVVIGAAIEAPISSNRQGWRHQAELAGWAQLPRLGVRVTRTVAKARRLSVSSLLRSFDIDVVNVPSPNDPAFVSHLSELKPDIVFNAGSRYLKAPVLAVPRQGWFNRHAGKLPDYRGVLPVFQALRAGEPSVTVTYHSMVEEIDGGTVLWEHEEPVSRRDSVAGLYARLFRAAADGFWDAFAELERGGGRPIDMSTGEYFSKPTPGQLAEFRRTRRRYA